MKMERFGSHLAAFMTMGAFAIVLVLGAIPQAQAQKRPASNTAGVPRAEAAAAVDNFVSGRRVLNFTKFQGSTAFISTSCGSSGCLTTTPIFAPIGVNCPGSFVGATCTYKLHLSGQFSLSGFDNGLFRYLVDGFPISPGPTDSNGFFSWLDGDPDSGNYNTWNGAYAPIAVVRNNVSSSQTHTVEIDIGCQDSNGNGCSADAGFAILEVDVFKP